MKSVLCSCCTYSLANAYIDYFVPKRRQVSVWDFPRPPKLIGDVREIVVFWGKTLVAQTYGAWAVSECF